MNYRAVRVLRKPVTVFKMQQFFGAAGFFTTDLAPRDCPDMTASAMGRSRSENK